MIDLDELIAPARTRKTYEVPGLASPTLVEYTPIGANNAAFLDAALRAEIKSEATATKRLDVLRERAAEILRWCEPTLTIGGEDRTADLAAFLEKLITLAPAKFQALAIALQDVKPPSTEALEGNSSPA